MQNFSSLGKPIANSETLSDSWWATDAPADSRSAALTGRYAFALLSLLSITAAAILAGCAPIWFAVGIVVVFGAPHNWMEFRYFLSRLPSKVGPFLPFFVTAFVGVFAFAFAESSIMFLMHKRLITHAFAKNLLLVWNELLIVWMLALCYLRYHKRTTREMIVLGVILGTLLTAANFLSPMMFTALLAVFHPLLGLWILEREIRRTRKKWLTQFHWCLLAIPLAVLCLIFFLSGTPTDLAYSNTLTRLSGNTGYMLFKDASPAVLLAIWAFLQMVHYAIWVFAMPLVTKSWKRWRVDFIPIVRSRRGLRPFLGGAIATGGFAVLCFWLGFKLDYGATMDLYVLLTTLHVLAEVPFMFWMCEN